MRLESRHYAFLGLAIVVIGTMALGIHPKTPPSKDSKTMFEFIDTLPAGTVLMVSFDPTPNAP